MHLFVFVKGVDYKMKKLLLIYNPFSGDKSFKYDLDALIYNLQKADYEVHLFRSMKIGDINEHIERVHHRNYDAIVISGGDGTVNIVTGSMMKNNVKSPLYIIPSGTANDFAKFLKLPKEPEAISEIIANGKTIKSDIGLVNGAEYFINVCAAGLFTNISQNIDKDFKDVLGKLAYYVKGLEQLPKFEPFPVRITNSKTTMEETIYFYLVLNSGGVGGFENLSSEASIADGLFDFIAVKSRKITDLAILFVKILSGDYLDDSGIIFFRDSYVKIESLIENSQFNETTLDGEVGPLMPVEIINLPNSIEIFIP